jgi:hypothetical protein
MRIRRGDLRGKDAASVCDKPRPRSTSSIIVCLRSFQLGVSSLGPTLPSSRRGFFCSFLKELDQKTGTSPPSSWRGSQIDADAPGSQPVFPFRHRAQRGPGALHAPKERCY